MKSIPPPFLALPNLPTAVYFFRDVANEGFGAALITSVNTRK